MFRDRIDAGMQLANRLVHYKNQDGVVLAIPRGGVPVGYRIAKKLGFPLEILLTKKIGYPGNAEYAVGAVSLSGSYVDETIALPQEYIDREIATIREALEKRFQWFHKNRKPVTLKGKVVILTDDGIATGNTILAALRMVMAASPAKIIVAVPVAPRSFEKKLEAYRVDEWICLLTPRRFSAVGQFYEDFNVVSDDEVIQLLGEFS